MRNQNYINISYLVNKGRNEKVLKLLQTSLKWILLTAIFITFSFLFNFSFNQENNKNVISQSQVLSAAVSVFPVHLTIPAIDVSAGIQQVGVTQTGEMEIPSNTVDVGWFKLGPQPGEKGSAVISGHFNGENGEAGVFTNLYKLKIGDKLYIENSKGTPIIFTVREKRTYDPGYADDVFSSSNSAHLNLITCDGLWDEAKKNYSKRLVVFTDLMH